ncbi:hypothetical protein A3715_01470 [Oleiphilus sp. HI0009]|uniref:cytochrome P450 n=2 Tax=Oleiphilus TaxID=141450 RepID=UPI0007C25C49|nr:MULTISPECIES: cytochrome P450 [unclassified Oleiphilus]KZX78823.1 hypothetical protein A3715_01470 [Oleiphilus sp. HI0009]KZY63382.1 hypothetical protein A3738_11825 [Oleiphilus sp. HI0066]KZY69302.1 hypothetical protein A3739_09115 [Oleiphilus sp. HI0067]
MFRDPTVTSPVPTPLKGVMPASPLIGNLFDFARNPLAFVRSAVNYGEHVADWRVPGERISFVTSAEMSHQILVKHYTDFRKAECDVGVMAHVLGNGLVTNNSYSSHKTQRKLAQPGFHFRRIQNYAQTMIDYSYSYATSLEEDEVRDVNDDMFKLTLYIVSKTLFNNDMEHMSALSDEIGALIHELQFIMNKGFQSMFVLPSWIPMPGQKRLARAKSKLMHNIETMIDARRQDDGSFVFGDDLLSMLMEAEYEDGSKMPKELLMEELITLLSAGHETTSNTMTWVFYLIASHPHIQQKSFDEIDQVVGKRELNFDHLAELSYTEQVVKEAMRMYPAAWVLNTRQANKDIEINGVFFPKDKHVMVSPYINHYNPKYFPDPDVFDPERFSPENEAKIPRYAYMPFGGGNRVCIGNSFAMMENKIILAVFVQQFSFSLCEQTKIEPEPQITLSNKGGMKLRVCRR